MTKQKEETSVIQQLVTSKIEHGTLKLTDELKKRALKAVTTRRDSVKGSRTDKIEKYDDWEGIYTAGQNTNLKQTVTDIMTTDAFNAVEDWVSLGMDTVFRNDPPFDIQSKRKVIPDLLKEKIKLVLNSNLRDTNYEMEFEKVLRQGVKLGTLVSKYGWSIDKEPQLKVVTKDKVIDGQTIKGEKEDIIEEEIIVEERPYSKFVDLRKLYFRPDKLTWIIEDTESTWSEIEKLANQEFPLYGNIDKAKETSYPSDMPDQEQKDQADSELKDKSLHKADEDVRLWEAHHIPLKIPGRKERVLCIVVVANETEVIRVQPTPFKKAPYEFTQFFEKPGVEGMGLIELLSKQFKEINSRRTMAFDANTKGLYSMKFVNMRYVKKPKQLQERKDGIVELRNSNLPTSNIVHYARPPIEYSQVAMDLLDRVSAEIVRSTRMKGILAGEKVAPNPTASEYTGMLKEAYKSVKNILRRISAGQFETWLNHAYRMNVLSRQKSWETVIKVSFTTENERTAIKEVPLEIFPQDIYSDGIDFYIVGIRYMEDEITTRHQEMQKLDILIKYQNVPMINDEGVEVMPDYYKQIKSVLASFGEENPDDQFVPKPPPPMPMQGTPQQGQNRGTPLQGTGRKPSAAGVSNNMVQRRPANGPDISRSTMGGRQLG